LESVANVQTDTDLHVRPRFSNRADQKSRGRRDKIRNTRGVGTRNGIDFTWLGLKSTCAHRETARAL
jgi:hypothetical protein